jgi:hypothetical protein
LIAHRTRHKLDGGLHFRHHPQGFSDPIHAGLAEAFLLSHTANGVKVTGDIGGNQLAVSTHAALSIDQVVGLSDATDALRHLLSLGADALQLLVCRLGVLLELLKACGWFWRTTWSALVRLAVRAINGLWRRLKALPCLIGRFCCGSLLGRHGARDGFDQCMLHMEYVRRVMRAKVMLHRGKQTRCFLYFRQARLTFHFESVKSHA